MSEVDWQLEWRKMYHFHMSHCNRLAVLKKTSDRYLQRYVGNSRMPQDSRHRLQLELFCRERFGDRVALKDQEDDMVERSAALKEQE